MTTVATSRFRLFFLLALASALLLAAVPARATDYIPLAEIQPGMTGYGLTVFEGTRIDTFGVTVVGVQDRVRVKGSLIIVEVSGHGLEISSIAQGMSGSPVFLDGRFAGALAFGWGGALRPLGGVTPAHEILALPTSGSHLEKASPRGGPVNPARLLAAQPDARKLAAELWAAPPADPLSRTSFTNPVWPEPETLLLSLMADILPAGEAGSRSWLHLPMGLAATAGAATAAGPLLPGSACAVPLVVGDAQLGAIGTVTWVDGQDVFMMGHPFMQRGPVNLPLATAEILTVFPSRSLSFKMGKVGDIVGSVIHDQRAGLAGKLGPRPDLIPVHVSVTAAGAAPQDYDFSVVSDAQLTPTLVYWSLYNALLTLGDDASRQNVSYELVTHWDGPAAVSDEPLVLSGLGAGPGGAMSLAGGIMSPLAILLNNPYDDVTLRRVDVHLETTRPHATARIVGLSGPREWPVGGGPLAIKVEVEPRFGDIVSIPMTLRLPPGLGPGPCRIVAASAAELFALEAQRAPDTFQPSSLAAIMDLLRAERAGNQLVLALLTPGTGVVVRGQEMDNLPERVSHLLRGGNMQAAPTTADYRARTSHDTAWLLQDHAVRTLILTNANQPVSQERRP